ncbi:MAG TPA: peptide-methionine (R)-S-oxide reductase MsrB [Candidatus Saccharimonadales bacterium]|nr:peptide-methionine (R)-S-oxide reductase MsrB [Candidatus Saccharimonadales bacterium]
MSQLSNDEYKQKLTPEQYRVLREKGTEAPGSSPLAQETRDGDYHCAACGALLFKSGTKFESTMPGLQGWPAFSEVANNDAIELKDDDSMFMHRTEIICKNCGSHLGHLFDNDPASPNGKHYCVNGVCLNFEEKKA